MSTKLLSLSSTLALFCLFASNPGFAQAFPQCASSDSDADGDGYGWENGQSCIVSRVTNTATTAECEDRGGFPWGWNPTTSSSCRLDGQATTNLPINNAPTTAACVDTDGDGYGWDGTASCLVTADNTGPVESGGMVCVDSDGDGFGWDGDATCLVEAAVASDATVGSATSNAPYIDRYDSNTILQWPGTVIDFFTNGWGPGASSSSVVLCEDPNTVIEHPSIPGYFFDPARAQTCSTSEFVSIPTSDGAVEFTDIGTEVLFENGNEWSCSIESRPTMDSEFAATGSTRTYVFEHGEVTITSRPGGRTNMESWGVFPLRIAPTRNGFLGGESYRVSHNNGTLSLYSSGLNRQVCTRTVSNYPFNVLGEDKAESYRDAWNDFIGDSTPTSMLTESNLPPESDLGKLTADQLLGQTLRCGVIYTSLAGNISGFTSETERVITVEADGDEYKFNGLNADGFTESAEGQFILTGGFERRLAFYGDIGDVSLLFRSFRGPLGQLFGNETEVYACETVGAVSE